MYTVSFMLYGVLEVYGLGMVCTSSLKVLTTASQGLHSAFLLHKAVGF